MKPLSPEMVEVVGRMRAAGGRLVRWPGGFWTTPGQPTRSSTPYDVPVWYASTGTVQALARRGLISVDEERTSASGSFAVGYRLVS